MKLETRRSGRRTTHRTTAGAALPFLLAAALPFLLAGCGGGQNPGADGGHPAGLIRIDVVNTNLADVTLHAYRGGERHRLGMITGKTEESWALPWPPIETLRLQIDLLAGGVCMTGPYDLTPGDVLRLEIKPDLRLQTECESTRRGNRR